MKKLPFTTPRACPYLQRPSCYWLSLPVFNVKIATVSKQSGTSDCGLFAIAYITAIAFGLNPSSCVFEQRMLRYHFLQCLEKKIITPFPLTREKRTGSNFTKILHFRVYCHCRCIDTGEKMVKCHGHCQEWFHIKYISSKVSRNKKWFCMNCTSP